MLAMVQVSLGVMAATIRGTVTDEKGEPLPYATVFLDGTTLGTTANARGYYEMTLSPGLYKIVCQVIGFSQASFNCSFSSPTETITHDFKLTEQSLNIAEVVIYANAEDPAYAIIRKAIERRKFHLDQVKSFQTSIFLKTVGRSRNLPDKFMGTKIKTPDLDVDSLGRGVLYLAEEYADYYATEGQEQTIIHSVHESGDPNGLGLAKLPSVLSFYENNLRIFSTRGSISPVSENALLYYKYKYLGQFTEGTHTVNKIQVTQRRAFEPCFNGYIYITDGDWAIHSLDLTLTKASGIELFDTVRVSQLFLPKKDDEWVIKSQNIYVTAKIFAFDITGTLTALYNNQKVNEPIPDSVFHKKITSIYDNKATKQDTGYWSAMHLVPLEKDELRNFKVQDSLNKRVATPQYLDSVRRRQNRYKAIDLLVSGKTFYGKEKKNSYSVSSLLFSTNYNIVEGANLAPMFTWRHMIDTGKYMIFTTSPRYGFSNTHFNEMSRLYFTTDDKHWRGRRWIYGIEGGRYVFQFNPDNPIYPIINSLDALVLHENDLKIYERTEASAFLERRYGNGWSWYGRISLQDRDPLTNTTNFSLNKTSDASFINNLPANLPNLTPWEPANAALFHFSLSWKPGITYVQYPDYKMPQQSKYPRLTLSYDKGIPGILNSKSDFDKYRFSITDNMRLKLAGTLSYNFIIGGFLNTNYVAVPDLNMPYGNRGIGFASPYLQSFQFMPYYDYGNKGSLFEEAHLEYKLKGLLTNKMPLLRKAQLYLVLGGNAYYRNSSAYYAEGFVGIDNIGWKAVRIFRLDFVQSWDSNMGHNSGIRLGISTSNGMSVSFGGSGAETHSEW